MAKEIKWDIIKGKKNLLALDFEKYSQKGYIEGEKALKKFSVKTTADAQRNCPATTGSLRASLFPYFRLKGGDAGTTLMAGGVASNKIYAKTQEKGMQGGRWVSKENLEIWARQKGYQNPKKQAYFVQKSINRKGVTGLKFMEKALNKNKPWLKNKLIKIFEEFKGGIHKGF